MVLKDKDKCVWCSRQRVKGSSLCAQCLLGRSTLVQKWVNNLMKDAVRNMSKMTECIRRKDKEIAELSNRIKNKDNTISGFTNETQRLGRVVKVLQGEE